MKLLVPLAAIALLAVACGDGNGQSSTSTTVLNQPPITDEQATGDLTASNPIEIALTLYLVEEAERSDSDAGQGLGSARTEAELAAIGENMGEIWAQAGVVFEPLEVRRIAVPGDVLHAIAIGADTEPFFAQVGRTFDVPDPGAINGFYLREAAGVNGFAPAGSRVFFVVDEPTVNDERVSSHEVGHLFGLHHVLDDPDRLLYSGTNGTALSDTERAVARYGAQGIVDRQR